MKVVIRMEIGTPEHMDQARMESTFEHHAANGMTLEEWTAHVCKEVIDAIITGIGHVQEWKEEDTNGLNPPIH